MLSVLKIRNIAIIENAEIEFNKGFNVLTGETGAGKSIILDSINAVLGFRTSRELIRTGETEAEVTALFSFVGEKTNEKLGELGLPLNDDNSLLITRTITADKNVCRVKNSLTSVSALREITEFMDDIVEYDSVVNQFFLPMIKSKFNNPKEDLEKELNEQKIKFLSYVNLINLRQSEEIKHAYEQGFKTAIKLIFESCKD